MTRTKIRLDTLSDVNQFVSEMSTLNEKVWLEDDEGNRVSAKSLLGAIYSLEWNDIYCYCQKDINMHLMPWAIQCMINFDIIIGEKLICPVCGKEFKVSDDTKYIVAGGYTCSWKCFLTKVIESSQKKINKCKQTVNDNKKYLTNKK